MKLKQLLKEIAINNPNKLEILVHPSSKHVITIPETYSDDKTWYAHIIPGHLDNNGESATYRVGRVYLVPYRQLSEDEALLQNHDIHYKIVQTREDEKVLSFSVTKNKDNITISDDDLQKLKIFENIKEMNTKQLFKEIAINNPNPLKINYHGNTELGYKVVSIPDTHGDDKNWWVFQEGDIIGRNYFPNDNHESFLKMKQDEELLNEYNIEYIKEEIDDDGEYMLTFDLWGDNRERIELNVDLSDLLYESKDNSTNQQIISRIESLEKMIDKLLNILDNTEDDEALDIWKKYKVNEEKHNRFKKLAGINEVKNLSYQQYIHVKRTKLINVQRLLREIVVNNPVSVKVRFVKLTDKDYLHPVAVLYIDKVGYGKWEMHAHEGGRKAMERRYRPIKKEREQLSDLIELLKGKDIEYIQEGFTIRIPLGGSNEDKIMWSESGK